MEYSEMSSHSQLGAWVFSSVGSTTLFLLICRDNVHFSVVCFHCLEDWLDGDWVPWQPSGRGGGP